MPLAVFELCYCLLLSQGALAACSLAGRSRRSCQAALLAAGPSSSLLRWS